MVASRGIDGLIPPCSVSGMWPNTSMGRRFLSLEDALRHPPRVAPTTDIPGRGHPLRVQGYPSPTSTPNARMPARVTPPRAYEPTSFFDTSYTTEERLASNTKCRKIAHAVAIEFPRNRTPAVVGRFERSSRSSGGYRPP